MLPRITADVFEETGVQEPANTVLLLEELERLDRTHPGTAKFLRRRLDRLPWPEDTVAELASILGALLLLLRTALGGKLPKISRAVRQKVRNSDSLFLMVDQFQALAAHNALLSEFLTERLNALPTGSEADDRRALLLVAQALALVDYALPEAPQKHSWLFSCN